MYFCIQGVQDAEADSACSCKHNSYVAIPDNRVRIYRVYQACICTVLTGEALGDSGGVGVGRTAGSPCQGQDGLEHDGGGVGAVLVKIGPQVHSTLCGWKAAAGR